MLRRARPRAIMSALLGGTAVALASTASARDACPGGQSASAYLVTLDGAVSATAADGGSFGLELGLPLCPGDTITTGQDGRVEIRFTEKETTVGLSHDSSMRLPEAGDTEANVELDFGILRFLSSVRDYFSVRTRHANAGIDGTEAVIAVDGPLADTLFVVQEGDVTVTERAGARSSLSLAQGQSGFVSQNAALTRATAETVPERFRSMVAEPEGAADWAIHFPPVLPAAGAPQVAVAAAERLDAGDPDGAEALLAGQQDAYSLALEAVIAIRRNRTAEGAELARRAITADPGLAAAHLAQSYALQAEGQIRAARTAAAAAVGADPADANARARLAELMLIEGDRGGALAALSAIPPEKHTAASRAVEGLALLASDSRNEAEIAFRRGIELESEAPLPRLGLGLLKIRRGDVAGGRRELELAAALDPRLASTRTWLGRAYAEEGLGAKAASQFEEAKARDADDPTPWLFSAREKFAANRPIEALTDLRTGEAKGRNRDTVRSAAGLGEDRAVRGAAIGRVDQVLGFETQAILAGTAAAETDPTNSAAHYLLADVLRSRVGRDNTRTSALLQAEVYDPPGKTIIRPQLAESNLALLETEGAARASFTEFAPLFDSDGAAAEIVGFGGTQDSIGDQASVSVLHQGFSLGFGQYHTQTDGYVPNNDVNHDIVSLQGRASVAPGLDLFAEYRYRDTDSGDRVLRFDESLVNRETEINDTRNIARLGFHAEIGADQDLAGVFTWADQDAGFDVNSAGLEVTQDTDREAWEVQLQHVGRFGPLTTVAGVSYAEADTDQTTTLGFFGIPFAVLPQNADLQDVAGYGYGTWRLGDAGLFTGSELTVGLSVQSFDDGLPGGRDDVEINPKAGVRIALGPNATLRGAYTRTVTPVQTLEQRLEPATVAGFAQFFDQFEGSTVEQAGAGGELRVLPWLTAGTEAAWRWVSTPLINALGSPDTRERELRGYLDATLGERVAASLTVVNERAKSDHPNDLDHFEFTELHAGASWFHPAGFFLSGGIGYVWHEFDGFNLSGDDSFPIADLQAGYRLPRERGVISLEIQNAFDTSFNFEDRPIQALLTPAGDPRFAREFTAIGRVTLRF